MTAASGVAADVPSEDELALIALTEENKALRQDLEGLRTRWQSELAAAERRARDVAASEHVCNDEKRLAALVAALGNARKSFDSQVLALTREAAQELALTAFEKLVAARQADEEWLARIIQKRIATLDRNAVITVQVSPDEFAEPVAAILPEGLQIEKDAALRSGTARIVLRLGAIEVDPATGLGRLSQLLRAGKNV